MTDTLTERQQLVAKELKKYTIEEGAHGKESFEHKIGCIMESLCLVLGYNPQDGELLAGYLNPPCISKQIKDFLVEINDTMLDKDRNALKSIAPLILNTAPTYYKLIEYKTKPKVSLLKQEKKNLDYRAAERERGALIKKVARNGEPRADLFAWLYTANGNFRRKAVLGFLKELVNVAKFENGKLVK